MIYEQVNFNEQEVKKMSATEFEAVHIDLFWQDRDEATRKKMLADAYKLMVGPATKKKQ